MNKSSRRPALIRVALAFVLAVLATYIVAAVFVSQWNIASIEALGLPVAAGERLHAALHDVAGMYEIYLPIIAIGFLIALPVAWLLTRNVLDRPKLLYPMAGFVALLAIHIALKLAFDVSAVAPTRNLDGLLGQAIAGALGGYAFFYVAFAREQAQ